MGRAFIDQEVTSIFELAVGEVTDTTYTKYVDVRGFRRGSIQTLFTSGVAGTMSYKIYASAYNFKNEADALANDAYFANDISSSILGATSKTASFLISDSAGIIGNFTWLKITATITTSDSTTALSSAINKCS